MVRERRAIVAAAGLLVLALVVVPWVSAAAATTSHWAQWTPLAGSSGAYTTTMQLPVGGFPVANVTTDSRSGQVGIQTGVSAWLGTATPPGAAYGSSQGMPYLNLRPRADNATSPSSTTYTFDRPTPSSGWAFVLGDIDADRAVVTARGVDGQLLTGAELGWQGGFNYCAVSPRPACAGVVTDVATWNPATGEVAGNAAGTDTSGASGWFQPTVPITSLTISFFQRSGFPVYQTWFAALARDISGTVLHQADGPIAGATLTLRGADGTTLATTTSAPDGTYSFAGYAAADGFTVAIKAPTAPPGEAGYIVVGPSQLPANLAAADAVGVDFVVRDIVPVPVGGVVATDGGLPVPGATVTLTESGGATLSAVSDSDGAYIFDAVPLGDYMFSLAPPAGYSVVSIPDPVTISGGSQVAITDQDFVVHADASAAGAVTAGGTGVPGALVTLTGPGGTRTSATKANGTYAFHSLPPGDYAVSIEVPSGYAAAGPTSQSVTIGSQDVADIDFAIARPGAIGGVVTDDAGDPVAGVTLVIDGPGGQIPLVTDEAGVYIADGLAAGDYTIVLTPPDNFTADTTERAVTISPAGENRLDQDFALEAAVAPAPSPSSTAALPATGADTMPLVAGAIALLAIGAVLLFVARRRGSRALANGADHSPESRAER